uniref:Uncharacterized protein n=1 Tax=Globisporangium ultimum (strain ATCC 200006 / CBS 805.95 / DAOM BR144) TaxID=431595 RepID=K3WNY1_GLOUD
MYQFSLVLVSAVITDDMDLVKWLHTYCPRGFVRKGMDLAASLGKLHIPRWVAKHHTLAVCSARLMELAAASGHLDVLNWLYAQPNASYTSCIMARAAANGHFKVVKWLHDQVKKPSSFDTLCEAIGNGHLQLAEYLLGLGYRSSMCIDLTERVIEEQHFRTLE